VDGIAYVGGSDFRRISAIDPATGRTLWATDVRGLTWGSPVVTADTVYAGTSAQNPAAIHHEGGITALDRRTGAVKWRHVVPLPTSAERAGYIGSLVLTDGKIIGAGFDGILVAYPAN
jgi:outer membrane protein assembly factor BamB